MAIEEMDLVPLPGESSVAAPPISPPPQLEIAPPAVPEEPRFEFQELDPPQQVELDEPQPSADATPSSQTSLWPLLAWLAGISGVGLFWFLLAALRQRRSSTDYQGGGVKD